MRLNDFQRVQNEKNNKFVEMALNKILFYV